MIKKNMVILSIFRRLAITRKCIITSPKVYITIKRNTIRNAH